MSVLCSICQDFLTERPQTLQANDDLIICALSCGHLFHRVCVNQWFQSNVQRHHTTPGEGHCPCCKKAAKLSNALRVFPTGDEESNAVVEQKKTMEAAVEENLKLATELSDVRSLLGQMEGDLEEEIVAHDMLKMEYGQVLSKMQTMEEQLNENLALKGALENSFKTITEKLEKEKAEALKKISEMEAREAKLREELEALKIGEKENIQNLIQKGQSSQQAMPNFQRELASIENINNGLNIAIKSCNDGQTSDGESPSSSPSSSQPKHNLFRQRMPNFSTEEESEIDDAD